MKIIREYLYNYDFLIFNIFIYFCNSIKSNYKNIKFLQNLKLDISRRGTIYKTYYFLSYLLASEIVEYF